MTTNNRSPKNKHNTSIKLINIQGLTKPKAVELETILDNNDIICLTETQQKVEKLNFSKGIKTLVNMREKHEKKGGGLMPIYKEKNVQVEIIETKTSS